MRLPPRGGCLTTAHGNPPYGRRGARPRPRTGPRTGRSGRRGTRAAHPREPRGPAGTGHRDPGPADGPGAPGRRPLRGGRATRTRTRRHARERPTRRGRRPAPLLYYMHGGGMVVGNAPSVVPQLLREWALPSAWPSSPSSTAWRPRSGTPNRWRTATPASSGRPSTPTSSASTRTASSSAARARAAASPRRSPCSPATGAVPRRSASCSCARCSTTATPPSPATRWPASTSGTAPPTPPGGRHSSATGSAPRTSRPTPPPRAPRTCPGSPGLHRRRVGRDIPGRGRGLRRRALAGGRPGRTARMARRLPRLRQPRPRGGPQPGRPRRPYALAPTRPHTVREPGDVGHTRPCHRRSGHLVSGM